MTTKTPGFTLVELLVAITIGAILLVFSIAPYNFYSEKSRVRLSANRIEQVLSKAKLMVASGFAPTGKSVDLVVVLSKGASRVPTYMVLAGGSGGTIP